MCDREDIEGPQTAGARGKADRPGDPLFPIMPHVLAALRARRAAGKEAEAGKAAEAGKDAEVDDHDYAAVIESICGATDDSQPVEQYDGTLGVTRAFTDAHQGAVGQIQWNDNLASIYTNPGNVSGVRWCSGTLISADLFLSAGHCFDQTGGGWERPRVNNSMNVISSAEIAQNMHVNFNYQVDGTGHLRTPTVVPIAQLIEHRLGGLDFAIVRLAQPVTGFGQAHIATTDANAGDMLCIMGHPAGVPKRIEAGPALAPSGNFIRYDDIDTLGGNSGSGVLRASDGAIVGVHTNGGCGPNSPDGTDFNFGQRIVALLAASPTLNGLAHKTPISDIHTGIAADFVATTKSADDVHSLKFIDDTGIGHDLGTTKFTDDIHTAPAIDHGPKLKVVDDPIATIAETITHGPGPIGDPAAGGFGGGGARPFALATPHHSGAYLGQPFGGEGQSQGQAAAQAALSQLAAAIAQRQAELEQLVQQYQQALAATVGGRQG